MDQPNLSIYDGKSRILNYDCQISNFALISNTALLSEHTSFLEKDMILLGNLILNFKDTNNKLANRPGLTLRSLAFSNSSSEVRHAIGIEATLTGELLFQIIIPDESRLLFSLSSEALKIEFSLSSPQSTHKKLLLTLSLHTSSIYPGIVMHQNLLYIIQKFAGMGNYPSKALSDVVIPTYEPSQTHVKLNLPMTLYPFQVESIQWMLSREEYPETLKAIQFRIGGFFLDIFSGYVSEKFIESPSSTGGLLFDVMGLGKTIMIISLIILHKFTDVHYDGELCPCRSTLIVTPATLTSQWIDEISINAPQLTFMIFDGQDIQPIEFSQFDIVLTTYQVLQKEIWFIPTGVNRRSMRFAQKYKTRNSALMSVMWWRVVVDEAQQVESIISSASRMAKLIPRLHPWVVTGTPVPKTGNISDMQGLFSFLKIDLSLNQSVYYWRNLNLFPKPALIDFFNPFVHRNTKENVADQLILPIQTDTTYLIPFQSIESQFYRDLVDQAIKDIGPYPINHDDKLNKKLVATRFAKMTSWLLRLRQTCCHPQASADNRQILGGRTESIHDVLDSMLENSFSDILTDERKIILNVISLSQILELQGDYDEAIFTYKIQLDIVVNRISEFIVQVQPPNETRTAQPITDENTNANNLGMRLRIWNELQHRLLFFIASAYHNKAPVAGLDTNEAVSTKEEEYYLKATAVRNEILSQYESKVGREKNSLVAIIARNTEKYNLAPYEGLDLYGGIYTSLLFDEQAELDKLLELQWLAITDVKTDIKKILMSSLDNNDYEENLNVSEKDEFNTGIIKQEVAMVYQDSLASLLSLRREALTGADSHYFLSEVSSSLSKELKIRISKLGLKKSQKNLKANIASLKIILNKINIPEAEVAMVQMAMSHLSEQLKTQLSHCNALDSEVVSFRNLFNSRVQYYSQLNKISDGVVLGDYTKPYVDRVRDLRAENVELRTKVAKEYGRKRYFEHLSQEKFHSTLEYTCGSCLDVFSRGALTECGHWFCQDCTKTWIIARKKCPTCSEHINPLELSNVSLGNLQTGPINKEAYQCNLSHINNVDISGLYGSKLDAVIKHIILLKSEDANIKVLCFSQWNKVLDILKEGLKQNSIGYIPLEGSGWDPESSRKISKSKMGESVTEFCQNENLSVFILNAKNQSSGLTLVVATHVFLIEPVLQKGIEQQAISRVHRIGQTKPTFVWRYVIQNTIEQKLLIEAKTSIVNSKLGSQDKGESVGHEHLTLIFDDLMKLNA